MPTASQKPNGYGIRVENQEPDLAAGSGGACPDINPRGRRGTLRPRPAVLEAAMTASRREVRDANTAARPDPCRHRRSGHAGRVHAASMACAAAAVWSADCWCGPSAGAARPAPGVDHREVSSPPDAPHRLRRTPEAPCRAPPGSSVVKGCARRVTCLSGAISTGGVRSRHSPCPLPKMDVIVADRMSRHA